MRKIFAMALLTLAFTACLDEEMLLNSRHDASEKPPENRNADTVTKDTVITLAAVSVDPGYDWLRDTLGGVFGARLVLLRNFRPELTLEISPENEISPDCDLHHLIDGHLYTLYLTSRKTVLKRDGETVFRTDGGEIPKGILPTDDGLLVLCEKKGGGLVLRKNGTVIFEAEKACAFGSLNDDSYPATGALYRDGGNWYFCYHTDIAGGRVEYVVENGRERRLVTPWDGKTGYTIADIKVMDGQVKYIARRGGGLHIFLNGEGRSYWENVPEGNGFIDGRLLRNGGDIVAKGEFEVNGTPGITLLSFYGSGRQIIGDGHFIVPCENGTGMLYWDNNGTHYLFTGERENDTAFKTDCLCFTHRCGHSPDGKSFFFAFTPSDGGKPYVFGKGYRREVDINGYLTAISTDFVFTSESGGSRLH